MKKIEKKHVMYEYMMEVEDMSDNRNVAPSYNEGIQHPHGNTVTVREMLDYLQGLVLTDASVLTRSIHVASGIGLHDVYQVEWSDKFGVVLSTI